MVDVHSKQQRSYNMSRIRGKDTRPELVVRSMVHRMGYRYRLHVSSLPGKPDLVFPRLRKIIFVHGCFWHKHTCRYGRVTPETHAKFWNKKRKANRQRDRHAIRTLKRQGWTVLVVWECWTHSPEQLRVKLAQFLPP